MLSRFCALRNFAGDHPRVFCSLRRARFPHSQDAGRGDQGRKPAGKMPVYRTRNYAVMTDLPEEEARDLMNRLETMLVLISKYWGKPNSQSIDMYVVRDESKWPPNVLSGEGLEHIRAGGGVTLGQTQQNARTGEILASRRSFMRSRIEARRSTKQCMPTAC